MINTLSDLPATRNVFVSACNSLYDNDRLPGDLPECSVSSASKSNSKRHFFFSPLAFDWL